MNKIVDVHQLKTEKKQNFSKMKNEQLFNQGKSIRNFEQRYELLTRAQGGNKEARGLFIKLASHFKAQGKTKMAENMLTSINKPISSKKGEAAILARVKNMVSQYAKAEKSSKTKAYEIKENILNAAINDPSYEAMLNQLATESDSTAKELSNALKVKFHTIDTMFKMEGLINKYAEEVEAGQDASKTKSEILTFAMKNTSAHMRMMELSQKGDKHAKALLLEFDKNIEELNNSFKPKVNDNL